MAFFDPKEEILDIQLTSHGKRLLSQGKFKPVYYAFYDDDIIYDARYASGNSIEDQNSIQDRIIYNTPTLKAQYNISSLDETLAEKNANETSYSPNFSLPLPLGRSSTNTDKAPSIKVSFLDGTVDKVEKSIVNNPDSKVFGNGPTINIPQVYLKDLQHKIIYTKQEPSDDIVENFQQLIVNTPEQNDFLIYHNSDSVLIDISEINVDDTKDSFEVEIFIEESTKDRYGFEQKIWKQLEFDKPKNNIKNGILVDDEEMQNYYNIERTGKSVDNYFYISADRDILSSINKNKAPLEAYYAPLTKGKEPVGDDC